MDERALQAEGLSVNEQPTTHVSWAFSLSLCQCPGEGSNTLTIRRRKQLFKREAAQNAAHWAPSALIVPSDPDLSRVIGAWSKLSPVVRAGILAMVDAAKRA